MYQIFKINFLNNKMCLRTDKEETITFFLLKNLQQTSYILCMIVDPIIGLKVHSFVFTNLKQNQTASH